jgi:transaldolase
MNKDKMANDLLSDGIRRFDDDGKKLKIIIKKYI